MDTLQKLQSLEQQMIFLIDCMQQQKRVETTSEAIVYTMQNYVKQIQEIKKDLES